MIINAKSIKIVLKNCVNNQWKTLPSQFIALSLLALATALPQERSVIPILRSDFITPDESGSYSVDFETGDGITRFEGGEGSAANGAVENEVHNRPVIFIKSTEISLYKPFSDWF